MFRSRLVIAAALVAGLSACGDTPGEQALFGAGAGAGAAAVFNGDLVTGAAVGAAGNVIYCKQHPNRC